MGKIAVIHPDGRKGFVPLERLDGALNEGGFRLANPDEKISVIHPDGRNGFVPATRINDALNKGGFKLTPPQSNLGVLGRSVGKRLSSIADIPQWVGEQLINNPNASYGIPPDEIIGVDQEFIQRPEISLGTPVTDIARGAIKRQTGFDLEPRPSTPFQNVLDHVGDFGAGVAPWNIPGALMRVGKSVPAALKYLSRGVKTGATIGGVSGAAQEYGGANPLAADLITATALPLGIAGGRSSYQAGKNLLSKFTKSGQEKTAQKAASQLLTDVVGKENIPQVLKNLDQVTPFGTNLTTAELAQNPGIAAVHRAKSPNIFGIAEKNAANDILIQREINKLGKTGLEAETVGAEIRKPIFRNLQKGEKKRTAETKPIYEKLRKNNEGVKIDRIKEFLNEEKKLAKGENAKALDFIEDGLKRNQTNEIPSYLKSKDFQELNNYINPSVGELDALATAVGDKISAAHKANKPALKRLYIEAKKVIEETIAQTDIGLKHRKEYSRLSIPVNKITESSLLNKLVKRDKYNKDFVTAPELIPDLVTNASLRDTRALINQVKNDKNSLQTIRGAYADKFIKGSELSAQNVKGNHTLSYDKIKKFLRSNEAKLNEVFERDQIKVLREAEAILKSRNYVATAGRAVGSNTQSERSLLETLSNEAGEKLLQEGLLGQIPGGKKIAAIFDAGKKQYGNSQKRRLQRLLEEALIDPKKAKTLLTPVKDAKPTDFKSIFKDLYKPAPPLGAAITINNSRDRQ